MDEDNTAYKKKPGILLVDDEPSSLKVLNQILSADYEIYMAKSGQEALELAVSESPDLILLDVVMEDMSGYEVLQQLKEHTETSLTPVIFITSLSTAEDEEKGLILGASDYITKPFLDVVVKARVKTQINNVRQRREIERLSMTDALTGIPNRRNFDLRLSMEWAHAIREKKPIAVMVIDLDNFKEYNDTFKHKQGDFMLKTVAGLLESAAKRAQDLAARIGGDEFAILLPNTELAPAVEIAGALRERIADLRLIAGSGEDTQMTVSIGVTCMRPAPDDPSDEFVDMADSYLYQAKNSGRNKVCFG
ncbi:MAG: diguanylate cyclase [Oscillospiraceae bacterium]|nr:diguanylate cyclase [Oscillospiraceae bacterium]